jgi:hypothetical protein
MQELLPLESLEVEVKQQCPSAHNIDKWDSERRVKMILSSGICVSSSGKKLSFFCFKLDLIGLVLQHKY